MRLNQAANSKHFKLAYSGGIDSHALLHALVHLRADADWQLSVVHVDHGLSPNSGAWARHCQSVCHELNVPCVVERVNVEVQGQGQEAAAREARYRVLAKHIGPGDMLLTAHQRDDQAETVLLHLLRGTGVHGLGGMRQRRPFARGSLLRPWLEISRKTIDQYAHDNHLDWIEDDSNRDQNLRRNFLRHEILPRLRTRWPGADTVLARSAGHAAQASALLDEIARSDQVKCQSREGDGLDISSCQKLDEARLTNLLRYVIRQAGLTLPTSKQLEPIVEHVLFPTSSGTARVSWPGGEYRRYRNQLFFVTQDDMASPDFQIDWQPPAPVAIGPLGIELTVEPVLGQGLTAARLQTGQVQLRNRRGGERLRLAKRAHRHKLKKLFQAAGVAPWERSRLPLIYVDNELAAVGDRWISASFTAAPREPGLRVRIRRL